MKTSAHPDPSPVVQGGGVCCSFAILQGGDSLFQDKPNGSDFIYDGAGLGGRGLCLFGFYSGFEGGQAFFPIRSLAPG
jgi:hypothetical protein